MSEALVRRHESLPPEVVTEERQRVQRFLDAATAANTVRAYRHDWDEWRAWCDIRALDPLPAEPDSVARHVAALAEAGAAVATIKRRVAAIGRMHREAGFDPPPTRDVIVQRVMTGIRRSLGVAPTNQREPLSAAEMRRLLEALPYAAGDLRNLRDRALLLVGWYGACRRSELVAFDVEDLTETTDGLRIKIRRSKTDQEGVGRQIGLVRKADAELCPVRAAAAWITASRIAKGPVWRRFDRWGNLTADRLTDQSVALVVKRTCILAGIDPARYAGHSLRAGFATSAAAARVGEGSIRRQTGHRSRAMLDTYIRHGSVFVDNATASVDL